MKTMTGTTDWELHLFSLEALSELVEEKEEKSFLNGFKNSPFRKDFSSFFYFNTCRA